MYSTQLGIVFLLILQFGNNYCQVESEPEKRSQSFLKSLSSSFGQVTQSTTCGIRNVDPEDTRTEAPWIAVLFTKYQDKNGTISHGYFGSGVVIGANMILGISGGAYGAGTKESNFSYYSIPPAERFVAVVGLKSIRFDEQDQYSQSSEINYIVPYIGNEESSDEFHFVIYHLKTVLKPTNYVREICLLKLQGLDSRDYLHKFRDSFNFQITGFALRSNENSNYTPLTRDIKLDNQALCDNAYRFYHGGNSADNIVCARPVISEYIAYCHFYGSVLTFTDKTITSRTYLGAVLTSSPKYGFQKGGPCPGKRVNFFTSIDGHADWIANNYKCSPTKFACHNSACLHLSKVCNGVRDCPDGEDEDRLFCAAVNICPGKLDLSLRDVYSRQHSSVCGYRGKCLAKSSICNGIDDCEDSSDESPEICVTKAPQQRSSYSACDPPILAPGIEISSCTNEDSTTCRPYDDQKLGTRLNLTCSKNHVSKYRYDSALIQCTQGGLWDFEKPFACFRDCGTLENASSFPWNLNIFKTTRSSATAFVCSGTLIESTFAVTDEDCLEKISRLNKNKVFVEIGSTSTTYIPGGNNTVRINKTGKIEFLSFFMGTLELTKANGMVNMENLPACYDKIYSVIKPIIGTVGVIPTILNKDTGLMSYERFTVVECTENPTHLFCVEGPANSNHGQGFFTIKDRRYNLVGVVTTKRSAAGGQPNGKSGTEMLYVLSMNSLNKIMIGVLEHAYS